MIESNMLEQEEVHVWQDLFTSIIEDANSNILLLNDDLKVINLNPGFYWIFLETYGIELKKGASILESIRKINRELSVEWHERLQIAMSGTPIKVEDTFEVDGRKYYWEIHFKSVSHADGSQILSVFSRDITVRKAYQKRILENEANLRSILNTIEDSVWLVNTNLELIDYNKEFYKKFKQALGIRVERGSNILDLIPPASSGLQEVWRQRYESGLKGKAGKYIDHYLIEKEPVIFEIKTYPIKEDGVVTGLTVYSRDITSQTRAENQLKKQNEELSKINAELDRFVYSASHDLRAPLMSVKGLLHMIKADPDPANIDQYVDLIGKSVNKLDSFISDIIHYSRNARMDVLPKEIVFEDLLKESIDSLRFMEGAEDVRSIKRIKADAPFYSDYSRLLIIFNNIISNAVRYRDRWKNDSFLEIDIHINEQRAVIHFIDNGVGIPDAYVDKIFKMFFRASADSKGSGLGLYIVKSAVEKLNGNISVSSTLGTGTVFRIEIPNLVAD